MKNMKKLNIRRLWWFFSSERIASFFWIC